MEHKIQSALISVFHKDGLEPIIKLLQSLGVKMFSTGGTQDFIEKCGGDVIAVEDLTGYPSILDGRVKTLHPKIFGGILARRNNESDQAALSKFEIPSIDLVIVDLYPFEQTVASGADESAIIEKIDVGGISLIRAAAKNFNDVLIISSRNDYSFLLDILQNQSGVNSLEQRKQMMVKAFTVSSDYDNAIQNYFAGEKQTNFQQLLRQPSLTLRYGENPHQQANYYGNLNDVIEQLHGKELSYNNLLDVDAAIALITDFSEPTFAVIKHNNACGVCSHQSPMDAWKGALAGDPVSAFGGVIVTNQNITKEIAAEIGKLFFEVLIAPSFSNDALVILKEKKNRVLLKQKNFLFPDKNYRSVLNGLLEQSRDTNVEAESDMKVVTKKTPEPNQFPDLIFANKIVKHSKSNAIVLAKNQQLLASGVGQTSRIDALQQAIAKAAHFNFDLKNSVMASDAFFPFPDCVNIAHSAGVTAIIQPGGSLKDTDSINACDANEMAMVVTGIRHFKH